MGNRIKLLNVGFAEAGNNIDRLVKATAKFVGTHNEKFLGGGLFLVVADDIRVRLGRKKDQKTIEKSFVKQQEVVRKHEAEINALRLEAEQTNEANRRIDQLEQIVKSIAERGGSL